MTAPEPYYQDEAVTLYQGDSLEILPQLDIEANALLTDPPYFKVKQDEWDNQWDKASEFLSWMGDFLDRAKPLLTANASVWVFASPAMTSSIERLIGERFRVLNSIRWVKEQGWHQKAEIAALRSYLTQWEGIVFAEQEVDTENLAFRSLRREIFAGVYEYFTEAANANGLKHGQISGQMGYDSALYVRWAEGSSLPKESDYGRLQALLGTAALPLSYAELSAWNERLLAEYEERRRPFNVKTRTHSTDVWGFPTVPPGPGKHPCEKPQSMLRHMIETSSRPGDLILDPFAGSGSTLDAARQSGRRVIGIEKDAHWCAYIARRLSQEVLDLGALA